MQAKFTTCTNNHRISYLRYLHIVEKTNVTSKIQNTAHTITTFWPQTQNRKSYIHHFKHFIYSWPLESKQPPFAESIVPWETSLEKENIFSVMLFETGEENVYRCITLCFTILLTVITTTYSHSSSLGFGKGRRE